MAGDFAGFWPRRPETKSSSNLDLSSKRSKKVSATPTVINYALEGTSETLKFLKSAVSIIGSVPSAQLVLDLALALIQTCQGLTEVEDRVTELEKQIEHMMLVMVRGIPGKCDADLPKDLIADIEKLGSDLKTIKQDLDEISGQNRFLVALFHAPNRAKIERCLELLKNSLVHWQIARDISQGVVLHDIQQAIQRVEDNYHTMKKPAAFLNRQAHTATHASTRRMPPKPTNFFGRDEFVEGVVKIIVDGSTSQNPPRICIRGPGGIGKTSAAITVMEHPDIHKVFGENHRFWVPCVSATSSDTLLHILYSNLRISRDTKDYLADIMSELEISGSPRLVLLDNFETPWNPIEGARKDVEVILNQLASLPQLSLLITMRTNFPPSEEIQWVDRPLGAVDSETSTAIYCSVHFRARGKPKLAELLDALGHLPFAVKTVATLGKKSNSLPEAMLKDWREQGPEMFSSDEDEISQSINLSMNSKVLVKNLSARTLLETLAMLPAGTTPEHLDWWAPGLQRHKKAAISSLRSVALVVDTEDAEGDGILISVIPVVRSFMQQCDRISSQVRVTIRDACYTMVLEHKSSPGDENFNNNLVFLSTEEVNIQCILLETTRNASVMGSVADIKKGLEVLIAFGWYQHWTRPRTEVIEHALKLAREARFEGCIAESQFCFGSILFRLDQYQDACLHFTEARDIYRKLSNVVRACECSFELVALYMHLGDESRSEAALSSISDDDMCADAYVEALGKFARGRYSVCYTWHYYEALSDFRAAQTVFEATEINRPVDAAYCLREIARVLGYVNMLPEATEAVNKSLAIYEKSGPLNRMVDTLILKGSILLANNAPFEQILPTLECALRGAQSLGGPLSIAQALDLLGELYGRDQRVSSALEYYKAAEIEYRSIPRYRSEVARCRSNCDQLVLIQQDKGLKWDGHLLSEKTFGDPFSPNVLSSPFLIADVLESLGDMHARQGRTDTALEYYKTAEAKYGTTLRYQPAASRCRANCDRLLSMQNDLESTSEWRSHLQTEETSVDVNGSQLTFTFARLYELLGELYARQGEVLTSLEYYRAAEVEYEKTSGFQHFASRCRANSDQLALREQDPKVKWEGPFISDLLRDERYYQYLQ